MATLHVVGAGSAAARYKLLTVTVREVASWPSASSYARADVVRLELGSAGPICQIVTSAVGGVRQPPTRPTPERQIRYAEMISVDLRELVQLNKGLSRAGFLCPFGGSDRRVGVAEFAERRATGVSRKPNGSRRSGEKVARKILFNAQVCINSKYHSAYYVCIV